LTKCFKQKFFKNYGWNYFKYEKLVQLDNDQTKYYKIEGSEKWVQTQEVFGRNVLKVDPEALSSLSREAMREVSFKLRPSHLEKVGNILTDPEASENDRFVARTLLENAEIAVKGVLPSCQDTGTAIVYAKKGEDVIVDSSKEDEFFLSQGVCETYQNENLRYSQNAPLDMFEEKNTGSNLPAQIDLLSVKGSEYKFLVMAKGGGSANKTYLFQETKALLNPASLEKFIVEKIKGLGTAACPPYHIAVVIGGTSAEFVMKNVKLGSTGYLDELPTSGSEGGRVFRDLEWEQKIFSLTQKMGVGAQFGGKYFAHDVKVIRAPRHGASCPVGLAVSCSADRNIKAKINADGVWIEQLENNPSQYLPKEESVDSKPPVKINLNRPMEEVLKELSEFKVKTRLSLTGTLIVARDIAHAKIAEMLANGEEMPEYFKKHPIYYAGPAKTPEGMPTGSFGPTTAGRMDPYVGQFQSLGGSMIMLAKGNRSQQVTDSCEKNGGFYLGSIGGPAAHLAAHNIKMVELVDFEELGMEAVRKIEVEDFPAFIIVDDKGNDFFQQL
jgi:fumarate hydratase class I